MIMMSLVLLSPGSDVTYIQFMSDSTRSKEHSARTGDVGVGVLMVVKKQEA